MFLSSCAMYRPVAGPDHPLQRGREQAREEMPALDLNAGTGSVPTDFIREYLDTYQLHFPAIAHRHDWGTFQSGGYTLVAQVFVPDRPRGTVFVLHGYMDHAGVMRHLIGHCLALGYAVALYDLPGHGLSSGPYATIPSFSDYADVFRDFVELITSQCPAPYALVSHSTGGAIALEYLSREAATPFDEVILVAPLVRHACWHPVKFFFRLGQLMQFQTVPRQYPAVSGDREFLASRRKDPLAVGRVPAQWVAALYAWEQRFQKVDSLHFSGLVLQGSEDSVVDGPYNVEFLTNKCPDLRVQWIAGGRHHLLNESETLRHEVLAAITSALEDQR